MLKHHIICTEEWLENEPIKLGTWEEASEKLFGDSKPIYFSIKQ